MTILLIVLSVTNQQNQYTEGNERCGQYGFRCVDSESYQICTYPDLDGQTEAPEIVRKCLDHNQCDEDNPAYCTPSDRIENESATKSNGKCQKKVFSKRSSPMFHKSHIPTKSNSNTLRDLNQRNRGDANPFGFNNEYEPETETTTTSDNDEYPSFKNQQFECESFGYFPGITRLNKIK